MWILFVDVYQIPNKLNKLITEARERTHFELTYKIILFYMMVNFGENLLYNSANINTTSQ